MHPILFRSSNKTGRIENNGGVLRELLERIQRADNLGNPLTIIARDSIITNHIRGSKVMSAFQPTRGYIPSVLGIPRHIVS